MDNTSKEMYNFFKPIEPDYILMGSEQLQKKK